MTTAASSGNPSSSGDTGDLIVRPVVTKSVAAQVFTVVMAGTRCARIPLVNADSTARGALRQSSALEACNRRMASASISKGSLTRFPGHLI
jgi:hypothetical protein